MNPENDCKKQVIRQDVREKKVAVLIDYENVGGEKYLRNILDIAARHGRITVRRAYANWSQNTAMKRPLIELGIIPVHRFNQSNYKPNATDILLTADAMELLFRHDVDVFVVVTGDSDFEGLFVKLREHGKSIVQIGRDSEQAPVLLPFVDEYVPRDCILPDVERPVKKKKPENVAVSERKVPPVKVPVKKKKAEKGEGTAAVSHKAKAGQRAQISRAVIRELKAIIEEQGGEMDAPDALRFIYRKTGARRLSDFGEGITSTTRLFKRFPNVFKGIALRTDGKMRFWALKH